MSPFPHAPDRLAGPRMLTIAVFLASAVLGGVWWLAGG